MKGECSEVMVVVCGSDGPLLCGGGDGGGGPGVVVVVHPCVVVSGLVTELR